MKSTSHRWLVAFAVAGAVAAAGCGNDKPDDAPAAPAHAGGGAKTTVPAASNVVGNGVDRAFAADMIAYHQSAIAMANVALRRGEHRFVKRLASRIAGSHRREISTIRREDAKLSAAGVTRGSFGAAAGVQRNNNDVSTLN